MVAQLDALPVISISWVNSKPWRLLPLQPSDNSQN